MTSLTTNRRGLVLRSWGGAFTLIELLTVIVIIAILVALLFPAIKTVLMKAESNQAKADTKNIENAISSYKNEYGKLPTQTTDQGGVDKLYDSSTAYHIYDTLRAISSGWNAGDTLNPRRIVFLETPSRKGAFDTPNRNFLDPWGGTYLLVFDCNYDGKITGLTGANVKYNNLSGSALVISYGPDRIATNADDIANYQ